MLLPLWLLRGISNLKAQLALYAEIDIAHLPYNKAVLEYVEEQHRVEKRQLVLCTGSHEMLAEQVCRHFDFFSGCLATDNTTNLTGRMKAQRLVEEYGSHGFDYIGNEEKDHHVWLVSRHALVVSDDSKFVDEVKKRHNVSKIFDSGARPFRSIPKQLRLHQWLKNVLVAVPLVLSLSSFTLDSLLRIVVAFVVFGLVASGTYILNDLFDLDADRRHLTKRYRPLANGALPIKNGLILMSLCISLGVILTLAYLPIAFSLVLLTYLATTLAYSSRLKSVAMLDVCLLAGLYTLRVVAGTVAIGAPWSFWLLAFSMFIFMSLALAKRTSELVNLLDQGKRDVSGRGYSTDDVPIITSMGVSSGLLSVLVIALYINSEKVLLNYVFPELLWLCCPALLYWIGRVWLITSRGQMDEDPIIFAISDRVSWILLAVTMSAAAIGYFLMSTFVV